MIITRMYINTSYSTDKEIKIRKMDALNNQEIIFCKGKKSIVLVGRIEIGKRTCNNLYREIKKKLGASKVYSVIDSIEPYNEPTKIKETPPEPKSMFDLPGTIWNIAGVPHARNFDNNKWEPLN